MCSFSGGAEQYVGTASDNNCNYFWCDTTKGMSGSPHCATDSTQQTGAANFTPQIGIPGSEFQQGASIAVSNNTATIANYVKAIYKYLIGIVGITAAIMLMVGGVVWLTAGGSPERVKQAQDYIVGSLTGLALALGSFLILGMINPALVNFRISGIGTVSSPAPSSSTTVSGVSTTGCCNGRYGCIAPSKDDCNNNGGNWLDATSINYTCENNYTCTEIKKEELGCCEFYAFMKIGKTCQGNLNYSACMKLVDNPTFSKGYTCVSPNCVPH